MYLARAITIKGLIQFGWKQCALFAVISSFVCLLYLNVGFVHIAIPFLPLGTAMAILLGFRNNSAYDRWWEARKIWGELVNQSRTWAAQVTTCLAPAKGEEREVSALMREMVYRYIAYLNALRLQLRKQQDWHEVTPYLSEVEQREFGQWRNKATQIIARNAIRLRDATERGWIDSFLRVALLDTLEQFYEIQGKCERIKNTPLARQYSFFTTRSSCGSSS